MSHPPRSSSVTVCHAWNALAWCHGRAERAYDIVCKVPSKCNIIVITKIITAVKSRYSCICSLARSFSLSPRARNGERVEARACPRGRSGIHTAVTSQGRFVAYSDEDSGLCRLPRAPQNPVPAATPTDGTYIGLDIVRNGICIQLYYVPQCQWFRSAVQNDSETIPKRHRATVSLN